MINKKNIMMFILSMGFISINLNASDVVTINGMQWQNTHENKDLRKNWNGAKKYCNNLVLEGYDDWKLPTIEQLQTLVDLKKYRPSIKEGITEVSVLTFYWAQTSFVEDEKKAWHIFYKYGESYYGNKGERYGVRCIRTNS